MTFKVNTATRVACSAFSLATAGLSCVKSEKPDKHKVVRFDLCVFSYQISAGSGVVA